MPIDIEVLKIFGSALLLIGFFYFITIRAIKTENYIRKSLYIFIFGFVMFAFFIGGFIYDIVSGEQRIENLQLGYFAYIIIAFILMLFFTLFYFIKGYKRKQKFKSNYKKPVSKPTLKQKKEYLYIILKYENNFLLQRIENKEEVSYKGISLTFPHNEFFHDELIKDFIESKKLNIISYEQIGKAIKREKVDHIYYCYKIFLSELPNTIKDLEEVDGFKVVSVNMNDMDKKIIFTSVVENNFNIDL